MKFAGLKSGKSNKGQQSSRLPGKAGNGKEGKMWIKCLRQQMLSGKKYGQGGMQQFGARDSHLRQHFYRGKSNTCPAFFSKGFLKSSFCLL